MIQHYSYTISLEFQGQHICGGAILSANCTITAAHCVGGPASYYTVRAGNTFVGFGGSLHRVAKITRHPEFRRNHQGVLVNDLAIVCLQEPFEFHSSRKVANVLPANMSGSKANATGWDLVDKEWPVQLRVDVMTFRPDSFCWGLGDLPKSQLCASHDDADGVHCKGHAGDPIVYQSPTILQNRLMGVASWSDNCENSRHPKVFTYVTDYAAWIYKDLENFRES